MPEKINGEVSPPPVLEKEKTEQPVVYWMVARKWGSGDASTEVLELPPGQRPSDEMDMVDHSTNYLLLKSEDDGETWTRERDGGGGSADGRDLSIAKNEFRQYLKNQQEREKEAKEGGYPLQKGRWESVGWNENEE